MPGVTSISADLHKYGYASKGVSVILYGRELARPPAVRDLELARWPLRVTVHGGHTTGGADAAGWAVLHHLGADGYLRLAEDAYQAASALQTAITGTPGWPSGVTRTPPCSPSGAVPCPPPRHLLTR